MISDSNPDPDDRCFVGWLSEHSPDEVHSPSEYPCYPRRQDSCAFCLPPSLL
ncbi:hypothetical protein LZ30DRAFT_743377 [Colletotrichum cereale]|nr:hypothetical protein LZ30DRAFT_743377 [Colletotrichum cereale]